MPRPTFIQSLLNRPSQTYSGPRRRKTAGCREGEGEGRGYHSVRDDMRRLAAADRSHSHSSFSVTFSTPNTSSPVLPGPAQSSLRPSHKLEHDSENGDSDDQVFFTPDASPRNSSYDDDHENKNTNIEAHDMTAVLPGSTLLQDGSCHTMVAVANQDVITVLDADPLPLSLPNNSEPVSVSLSVSVSEHDYHLRQLLSSASSSTSSLDGASHTPSMSESSWPTSFSPDMSRATTPATSESGHVRSSSTRSTSPSRRRKDEHRRSMTYTDDDWAKDVRWLVSAGPPTDKKNSSTASLSRSSTSVSSEKKTRNRTSDPSSTLPSIPLPMRTPHRRTVSNSTTTSRRSMGKRRMSAVWEEDEGDEPSANTVPRRVHTDPVSLASLGRSHSFASMHRAPQRSRSPSSVASGETGSIRSSAFTSASRTVDLPVPLLVSDGGTPSGFTSLVLPRAAYTPSSNKRYSILFGNSSHVDITRSGMAQTTMSTVSITKNATSSLVGQRPRFRSLSSLPLHSDPNFKSTRTPAHLLSTLPPPISFNSHTPPPSKVTSSQVLVQVYAVAVDGLDDRIVAAKLAKNDCYGFVPGRAFVGRAVEVGFEVNNVAKSDWVVGLLDVRKCGALAEFVLVERRRITRCPRPSPSLTLEQLALLPLCGVPAHRAVHTCGFDADSNDEWPTGRALVLQGHDGIGALVVQALAKAGMHVTAHIPLFADRLPEVRGRVGRERKTSSGASSSASSRDSERNNDENENESGSERRKASEETEPSNIAHSEAETFTHTYTREAEERVRRWGARGVRVGDAMEVVENCAAGAFDVVIDTVGGKRIWDASERVLASNGQFTTLVGDVAIYSSATLASASTSSSTTPLSSCTPSASSSSESSAASSPASHSPSTLPSSKPAPSPTRPAIPSIPAHFRANLRSLRRSFGLTFSLHIHLGSKSSSGGEGEEKKERRRKKKKKKNVCYALVSPAADVDHYGEDVRDSLGAAVRRAGRGVFVPFVPLEEVGRVVPFERAPGLFGSGVLGAGRTAVVRIVD